MGEIQGGVISAVLPGGIGAEVGMEPGDRLVSINGQTLRDQIDYRYYGAEEALRLVVERDGQRHTIEIERELDEDLGLLFDDVVFDDMRQCQNHCPFCFVQQMPPGMRRTLYLRDDDYRYSFLLGNFVTLTNLSEADWQRIAEQRLSPLYVSVHATDLATRRALLGNPRAPDIAAQLRRLGELRVQVHAQIVLVPGMNDGPVLRESVETLRGLWPVVQTLAVVPVGLTRYHRGAVQPLSPAQAAAALDLAETLWPSLRAEVGGTWLYPADELFLLAGRPIPPTAFYDDPAQQENGVGLVRLLLDDWHDARQELDDWPWADQPLTWVCGSSIAPVLQDIARELAAATDSQIDVLPVVNRFFGERVTVSGLLTGQDALAALQGRALGRVALPRAMFDAEGAVTLDDMTPQALAQQLGVPLLIAENISDLFDTDPVEA